jgi:hypothetical protein
VISPFRIGITKDIGIETAQYRARMGTYYLMANCPISFLCVLEVIGDPNLNIDIFKSVQKYMYVVAIKLFA